RALRAHGPCPEHRQSFVNVGGVSAVACGPPEGADGMPEGADGVLVGAGGVPEGADGVLVGADGVLAGADGGPGADPAQQGDWVGPGPEAARDDHDAEAAWSDHDERTAWSDPGLEN